MRSVLGSLLLAIFLTACASVNANRAGEKAEQRHDFDRAVLEYSRALQQSPKNRRYRESLERVRIRASEEHAAAARRFMARGLYKEASDELRLAMDLNPQNSALLPELQLVEAKRNAPSAEPTVDQIKARGRERSLPGLVLGPGAIGPLGLSFRNASLRETYLALGQVAGVNFVFDPQFQEQTITLDLRDVPFEQALNALASVGHNFHRVLDARVINVVPDTPTKRREFEQQVLKTFFLSNADLKETVDLLRVALGARRVSPVPGSNAVTIADTPEKIAAAERLIEIVDKQRAEVMVEVEILEVNRTRLRDYGLEITSVPDPSRSVGLLGGIFPEESDLRLSKNSPSPYRRSNLVISSLPGVIYRLLKTDASARLLANPQLRASEGQTAQARFGDQIPVPVTTFSPLASGGVAQQPITSFSYKDVGVNIDITPRVHHNDEVSLTLKLDISSQGAPGFSGLPTFSSRQVTTTIRLHDGETNILAGLISDAERQSLSGLPGLSDVPFVGRLFGRNHKEATETDIVMTLTPRIIRRTSLTDDDLRSIQLGSESSPLMYEVPASAVSTPLGGSLPPAIPDRVPPQPIRAPTVPAAPEPDRVTQ